MTATKQKIARFAQRSPGDGRRPARPLRVLLAGLPAAMTAPGGGEVQFAKTAEALAAAGHDARMWRAGEALDGADCLHLFGSHAEHLESIAAARRAGVPTVLSTIAWFDLASVWREPRGAAGRVAACGKFLARAAQPRLPSWRRKLYHAADLLLPNSQAEAGQLMRYFGVPAEKIRVVPNGADARFAGGDPGRFAALAGGEGFVLYAGRIEPRKNQWNFLRAMRGSSASIVVLGAAVPGHEAYAAECRRAAGPGVRFIGRIDHDDPLLAGAYAACGCLALCSWFETPGLVALEAAMGGVPLVLPEGGCAREYFGERAAYVAPGDLPGIRAAVLAALQRPRDAELAALVRGQFSWTAAAEATAAAYEAAIEMR